MFVFQQPSKHLINTTNGKILHPQSLASIRCKAIKVPEQLYLCIDKFRKCWLHMGVSLNGGTQQPNNYGFSY